MLCSYHFALVFVQCPPPGQPLELWVEGICVCTSTHFEPSVCYIHLNSFFIVSFSANNVSKQSLSVIFPPLFRTLRCLWRPQHTAQRHLRESLRPWLLPHVQSQRGAEDPERPRKRGGPTGAGRPWHTLHRVWTGGLELAVCRPQRGQAPGARWAAGPPRGADWAGWISSSHSPSKWEASSATTPTHTHRKHVPLWFNVSLAGIDNYSVLMKECLVCVSFFMWKATDPRHHFNQGWRGYWWRHACCRLVIHIAYKASKKMTWINWECTLLLKKQGLIIQVIVELLTCSSWQTGVRNVEISSDSQ